MGPNINAVNAPLDWCKTAWEATARNLLLLPGKVQNATYTFKCRLQPGAPGPAALPDPSLHVPTEKGTCQAPRCPITPGLQSPLPFVGPPARLPCTPDTHPAPAGEQAVARLEPCSWTIPAGLSCRLRWAGWAAAVELGSWAAGKTCTPRLLRSRCCQLPFPSHASSCANSRAALPVLFSCRPN